MMQKSGCKTGRQAAHFVNEDMYNESPQTYWKFEPLSANQRVLFNLRTECDGNIYEVDNYANQPGKENCALA